jgi:hypothetical protein
MEICKRYIFVGEDNKTFAGDVENITDKTLMLRNHSDETYQNGQGVHSMSLTIIKSTCLVDKLVVGQHYVFTLRGTTIEGEYMSISWKSGTVCIRNNTETISFPFYWIQNIHSSDNLPLL